MADLPETGSAYEALRTSQTSPGHVGTHGDYVRGDSSPELEGRSVQLAANRVETDPRPIRSTGRGVLARKPIDARVFLRNRRQNERFQNFFGGNLKFDGYRHLSVNLRTTVAEFYAGNTGTHLTGNCQNGVSWCLTFVFG